MSSLKSFNAKQFGSQFPSSLVIHGNHQPLSRNNPEVSSTSHALIQSRFAKAVGKAQQRETSDVVYPHILDVVLIRIPCNAQVLIEHVRNAKLDFPAIELEELLADARIPKRNIRIIPFRTHTVDQVSEA